MKKFILFLTFFFGAIQLYAQGCVANITLTTSEISTPVLHQASNTIVTSSGYGVSSGYDSTLRAGTLVELKNDTHIKPGSLFLAKIGACTKAKSGADDVSDKFDEGFGLKVYPNPVKSTLTISVENLEISKVIVATLDGKVMATHDAKKQTSLQLDFSNYTSGVYMVVVETSDGQIFKEKIFKD